MSYRTYELRKERNLEKKTVQIKDSEGRYLCTVQTAPLPADIKKRYWVAKQGMQSVCASLVSLSITADGRPAALRYMLPLRKAEKQIKTIITELLQIDDPDGLFRYCRPFASVKGEFYCTHIIDAVTDAVLIPTGKEV